MSSIHEHIRARLHAAAGILPELPTTAGLLDYPGIVASQWSDHFEQLMRNRLAMGYLRYGRLGAPCKPSYDSLPSIRQRLLAYEKTGNTEHLVDVANLCLVEFVEGRHPNKHFAPADDGIHVKMKKL